MQDINKAWLGFHTKILEEIHIFLKLVRSLPIQINSHAITIHHKYGHKKSITKNIDEYRRKLNPNSQTPRNYIRKKKSTGTVVFGLNSIDCEIKKLQLCACAKKKTLPGAGFMKIT